jgi:hypothetical protein
MYSIEHVMLDMQKISVDFCLLLISFLFQQHCFLLLQTFVFLSTLYVPVLFVFNDLSHHLYYNGFKIQLYCLYHLYQLFIEPEKNVSVDFSIMHNNMPANFSLLKKSSQSVCCALKKSMHLLFYFCSMPFGIMVNNEF